MSTSDKNHQDMITVTMCHAGCCVGSRMVGGWGRVSAGRPLGGVSHPRRELLAAFTGKVTIENGEKILEDL